tara:strand:+ start:1491 stop:2009 length:519 start_codon:yes stop_codon:yes gene_type:complete
MPEVDESLAGENNVPPASKKKLIIIIVAVVLLLSVAGGGAFFLFSGDDAENTEEMTASTDKEVVEVGEANYVPMPRPFVFNVLEGKRVRTVQIKIQLMVTNKSSEALVRKHTPLLESTLVSVFGAATIEQLRSPEGKNQLRKTALEELNKATTLVEKSALIHTVLFTGFVLQ